MRFDGKTTKQRAMKLNLTKLSNVESPAHGPALAKIVKSKGGDEEIAKNVFNEVLADMALQEELREILDDIWKLDTALRSSIWKIIDNTSGTYADKKQAVKDSTLQFISAIQTMVNNTDIFKGIEEDIEKAKMKMEDGVKFPSSDYAYVPDSEKSSTWKLRLTSTPGGKPDPRIVGAAVAALGKGFRGQKVQIPSKDLSAVKTKVRRAWLSANPKKGKDDLPSILKKEKQNMSEELKKQMDEMNEKLKKAEILAAMSDAEKAFLKSLSEKDQKTFMKSTSEERTILIKKSAESSESFEMDGIMIQKSTVGETAFKVMKAQQKRIEKAEALAKAEKEARIQKEYGDKAEKMFPNLPGDPMAKGKVLKSIEELPDAEKEVGLGMLKSKNTTLSGVFKEQGHSNLREDEPTALKKQKDDLNSLLDDKYGKKK